MGAAEMPNRRTVDAGDMGDDTEGNMQLDEVSPEAVVAGAGGDSGGPEGTPTSTDTDATG
jgi:hypothetical protein